MTLSVDQITALRTEISTGPLAQTIAPLLQAEHPDYQAVADLLNSQAGAGARTIPRTWIPKPEFIVKTLPMFDRVNMGVETDGTPLDTLTAAKWKGRFANSAAWGDVIPVSPVIALLIDAAVADKVGTQDEADSILKTQASAAEAVAGHLVDEFEIRQCVWNDDASRAL